jgi:hypothetical protein
MLIGLVGVERIRIQWLRKPTATRLTHLTRRFIASVRTFETVAPRNDLALEIDGLQRPEQFLMAIVVESFCGHTRCWPKVLTDEAFVHMEMLVTTSSQSMQHPIDAHRLAWSAHQSGVR